jgi:hypothetical protein
MAGSSAQVISIEHKDSFVPAGEGVPEAAWLLRAAIVDLREHSLTAMLRFGEGTRAI